MKGLSAFIKESLMNESKKNTKRGKYITDKILNKIKKNSKPSDLCITKIKKSKGNENVNEVRGWSAERSDWAIVGGKLEADKQYCAVKLWCGSGYLLSLFIAPYDEYAPTVLNYVHEEFKDSHKELFPSMDDYYNCVEEWKKDLIEDRDSKSFTWTKENSTDDDIQMMAEEFAEEYILPLWDYDFCVYGENCYIGKAMTGEEIEKKLNEI